MNVSHNKRIILNICATYGRSVFAMICGIFTSRWTLNAIGQVDLGLYTVVGGLTVFIAFFNNILASSLGRFYAFSVGESMVQGNEESGLERCRQWFNTACFIHTVFPTILVIIGYPIGVWLVRNWLTIPYDRINSCIWVFRFVCLTCFVGMINVPYNAMYIAKQNIAELTFYSFASTLCNLFIVYYMFKHPGFWLVKYAFFMCCLSIIPQIIICIRAIGIFPECHYVRKYLISIHRIKLLLNFAGWQLFGNLGYLVKNQGIALLVNKMFGPIMNTSMAIANSVSSHTDTLASSMNSAFSPAIMNLAGAGEKEKMLEMSYRSCKLGGILSLIFILPLSLEIKQILIIWLKNPPPMAAEVCLLTFVALAIDETARGIGIAVTAYGKIALYYVVLGSLNIISLPIASFIIVMKWGGFLSIFWVLITIRLVCVMISAIIAQKIISFSFIKWFNSVFVKLLIQSSIIICLGLLLKLFLKQYELLRILINIISSCVIFAIMSWVFMLESYERTYLMKSIRKFINKK